MGRPIARGIRWSELARRISLPPDDEQVMPNRGAPLTKAEVARIKAWIDGGATDGFLLGPSTLPGELDDFVTMVVPELQRRGVFRDDYEGKTLREIMGLPRPPHPAALAKAKAG